ncbi:MAG: peptide ABC transporter substrate-binding protein, partial [Planctomycetota bacterium]
DGLIAKAGRTPSREERYTCFQRCEDIMAAEVPIIPIYTATHVHLMRPEVRGLPSNVMEIRRYKLVWLEAAK